MSSRESKPESCKAALTVNSGGANEQGAWFGCDNPHPNHDVHFNKMLKARWVSVLAVFAAILAAATLGTGAAKATPLDDYVIDNAHIVCSVLDDEPSVAGVEIIGITLIQNKGFTPEQAGEIVARSIVGWCPSHTPELQAFIAKWTRSGQVRA